MKDPGGSEVQEQENASDSELSVSEEEVRNEDEIENASDLSATSDAIHFL